MTLAVISPQGERWIISLSAHGRRCPGGDQHEQCLTNPNLCNGTGATRPLNYDEEVRAMLALGYEVEGANQRTCRHCHHAQDAHPNGFLCAIEDCRCPGFFLDRPWHHRPEEGAA